MKRTLGLAALAAVLASSTALAQQVTVKIGVLSDMSSLYADIGGPGSVAAAKLAVADFNATNKDVKVEIVSGDHQNKADVGSSIANQWLDVEKVDMIVDVPNSGVALAVNEIIREQEQGVREFRRRIVGSHRREVLAQHRALDLRHLDAGERHRQGDREDRRRHLVLPHRRLCVRSCARARHVRGCREERRQGGRQGPSPDQHQRLLVVPAAGADLEGEGYRSRQRRRRHHQLDQGGRGIRHHQGRPEASRVCWCSRATSTRSACRPRRA